MWSNFSCAYWSSVYRPWKNVYLVLLPILQLVVWFFVHFIHNDANILTVALMVKVWVLSCKHWESMRKFELSSV